MIKVKGPEAEGQDDGKVYRIYCLEDTSYQKDTKMYFTGTEWGGPGYFNHRYEAFEFETLKEAEEAIVILDSALEVPVTHYIEEIINE